MSDSSINKEFYEFVILNTENAKILFYNSIKETVDKFFKIKPKYKNRKEKSIQELIDFILLHSELETMPIQELAILKIYEA